MDGRRKEDLKLPGERFVKTSAAEYEGGPLARFFVRAARPDYQETERWAVEEEGKVRTRKMAGAHQAQTRPLHLTSLLFLSVFV